MTPDTIAIYMGYTLMFLTGALLIVLLLFLLYVLYDYILSKLLGWKDKKIREEIFYYMRNKDKIRACIEKSKK